MTDAQKSQVREICGEVAKGAVGPETYKSDPYLKLDSAAELAAFGQVSAKVLTPEQRQRMQPATGR